MDVVALFEQIQAELRGVAGQEADAAPSATRRAELRLAAERWWSVSAERPIPDRAGRSGRSIVLVKKVLKRLMRWYVDPLAHDQRTFNDAALKLVDDISRDLDWTRERALAVGDELIALQERYDEAQRRARELEERLLRLERRPAGAGAQTVAAQPAQANVPDYFAFESVMRGSVEEIRARQARLRRRPARPPAGARRRLRARRAPRAAPRRGHRGLRSRRGRGHGRLRRAARGST